MHHTAIGWRVDRRSGTGRLAFGIAKKERDADGDDEKDYGENRRAKRPRDRGGDEREKDEWRGGSIETHERSNTHFPR